MIKLFILLEVLFIKIWAIINLQSKILLMPLSIILRALKVILEEDLANTIPKCTKLELRIFWKLAKRKT